MTRRYHDARLSHRVRDAGAATRVGHDASSPPSGDDCWIQTFSGLAFHPFEARASDICIEDIAHALSNLCRFTGHVKEFYSVAEHCVRVSWAIDERYALEGLLHDASEAYLVDLPSPIKRHPSFEPYRRLEGRMEDLIQARFGLAVGTEMHDAVKKADLTLLATEARDLMGPRPKMWVVMPHPPLEDRIYPWCPEYARKMFLARFTGILFNTPEAALGVCEACGGAVRVDGGPLVNGLWRQSCLGCSGDFGSAGLLAASERAGK